MSSTKIPTNSAFKASASAEAASSAAKLCVDVSRATMIRRMTGSTSSSFIPHAPSLRHSERRPSLCQCHQAGLHALVYTPAGELSLVVTLPGRDSGQSLNALVDCLHRKDMKLPGGNRV